MCWSVSLFLYPFDEYSCWTTWKSPCLFTCLPDLCLQYPFLFGHVSNITVEVAFLCLPGLQSLCLQCSLLNISISSILVWVGFYCSPALLSLCVIFFLFVMFHFLRFCEWISIARCTVSSSDCHSARCNLGELSDANGLCGFVF